MDRKRKSILLTTLSLLTLILAACGLNTVRGSGGVVEETRAVSDVTSVELATIGTLHIEVGSSERLVIEAQDNLMEYIETAVLNGELRIGTAEDVSLNPTRSIRYYLTVTSLDSIEISSVGDIEAPDLVAERFSITITSTGDLTMEDLEAESVTVDISSTGNVRIGELNANTLEVDIESTGNLDIAGGEVKTQTISIGSSGKYNAEDLASDEADARLSSTGSATIWVRDHLKARLSSSGDLRYRGDPTVDVTTNSSGDIIHLDN